MVLCIFTNAVQKFINLHSSGIPNMFHYDEKVASDAGSTSTV